MQYELYIDIFIFVNFVMDYLVLLIMRKILKCNATHFRIFVASIVGAGMSAVLVCVSLPETIKLIVLHLGISYIMLKLAFDVSRKNLLKEWCLFYFVGILMGGLYLFVSQYLGYKTRQTALFLAVAIITYFLALKAVNFWEMYWKTITKKYNVSLQIKDEVIKVGALYDTGNMLFDNITGNPVHIISAKGIKKFTNEVLLLRYIPYQTIQGECQVIPLVRADCMCIQGKRKIIIENPYIAISECMDFGNGDYELILHPACMQEDRNDDKNSSRKSV